MWDLIYDIKRKRDAQNSGMPHTARTARFDMAATLRHFAINADNVAVGQLFRGDRATKEGGRRIAARAAGPDREQHTHMARFQPSTVEQMA